MKKKKIINTSECNLGNKYIPILIILTIISAILRFTNLGFNSLWLDEATTQYISSSTLSGIWEIVVGGEFNPPLFYWMEHYMLMLGNTEIILRLLPAIFGILTIPVIYYVGKEFIDKNVGIIAAAVFTFSPFLIFYSQEARAYAMMMFFVATSMIFYFRAMKNDELLNWLLFSIFSALALWSHFYAFIIIFSLILYAIAIKLIQGNKKSLVFVGLSIGSFIIMISPLLLIALRLFGIRSATTPAFGIQGLGLILGTFIELSGFSDVIMIISTILFFLGIIVLFGSDYSKYSKGLFLLVITTLVFIFSLIFSYKIPMVPRYLIFFDTIFVLGIAASYKGLYKVVKDSRIVYAFIALLVLMSVPMLTSYYSGYTKDDWKGFSNDLNNLTQPGDIVVVVPAYIATPLNYYYSNITDVTMEYGAYNNIGLNNVTKLKTNNTIYYVVTPDISAADPSGSALQWLNQNTKPFGQNNNIYLFTSNMSV
jgi:mannosyltransferase